LWLDRYNLQGAGFGASHNYHEALQDDVDALDEARDVALAR
jgi:hypothetical protein